MPADSQRRGISLFSIIAAERSQPRIIYVNERRVIKHITTLWGGTAVTTRSVSASVSTCQAAACVHCSAHLWMLIPWKICVQVAAVTVSCCCIKVGLSSGTHKQTNRQKKTLFEVRNAVRASSIWTHFLYHICLWLIIIFFLLAQ